MNPKLTAGLVLVLVLNIVPLTIGSFIVPEEFATLLGLVFSTIPQVKKGTDSRIGFGYRFGNHADTQVVLEIGPQKNTQKLGDADADSSSGFNSKRQVDQDDYKKTIEQGGGGANGSDWLKSWSKHMNEEQKQPIRVTTAPPSVPTVKVKPFIPESSLKQLVQLYGKKSPSDGANSEGTEQLGDPMTVESSMDSVIQFQDRHRVFLKRPSQEKLNHYDHMKKYDKKKITHDLMNVDFD